MDVMKFRDNTILWSHTQFLCAWTSHVHSMYVTNEKRAMITVITN